MNVIVIGIVLAGETLSGSGGGGGGNGSQNSSSHLQNFNVEIDHDDPSKLFTDLTEIGHGNFGAVYYVI